MHFVGLFEAPAVHEHEMVLQLRPLGQTPSALGTHELRAQFLWRASTRDLALERVVALGGRHDAVDVNHVQADVGAL